MRQERAIRPIQALLYMRYGKPSRILSPIMLMEGLALLLILPAHQTGNDLYHNRD